VVLNEPDQPLLVRQIGAEMQADALRTATLQAVIEPLVVTVIKALLLQFPFQIPVGLGDEEEIRVCCLDAGIRSAQYSVTGACPARLPQVRANTAFSRSIAISQRIPSHWLAISAMVSRTALRRLG
jgi:hypothetical protein